MNENVYKNVKINEAIHRQVKKISLETGINVGKLVEMGVSHVVEGYHNGEFDKLIENNNKRLRRDGVLSRS